MDEVPLIGAVKVCMNLAPTSSTNFFNMNQVDKTSPAIAKANMFDIVSLITASLTCANSVDSDSRCALAAVRRRCSLVGTADLSH